MAQIRVLVNGALGKMGGETCRAVQEAEDMLLAGETDLDEDLSAKIAEAGADVVVDFTHPSSVRCNANTILEAGVRGVIGTTGLSTRDTDEISSECGRRGLGMVVAPNFTLGVVLMMRFAREAARHFPAVEIIEMHHDRKADAPSGTALATAETIAQARTGSPPPRPTEKISVEGARGGTHRGIPLHSVRLPGLLAHQEVIFGGTGQVLTIRQDTLDRKAFMPGVLLAVRKVIGLERLVFGLEELL